MLSALRKGFEVLNAVDQHYFQAVRSPELNREFDEHLEKLTKFHEHIMLKFDDKLKPNYGEAMQFEQENDAFLRRMLDRYAAERTGVLRLSIVSAEMYEYGHQLERLNRLADHAGAAAGSKISAHNAEKSCQSGRTFMTEKIIHRLKIKGKVDTIKNGLQIE